MWNVLKILQIEPNLTWPKLCNGFGVGVWVNAHVSSKAKPSWWRSSTQAPLPLSYFGTHVWEHELEHEHMRAWAYQITNSLPGFKLFLRPWLDIFGSTLINNNLVLWNYPKASEKDIIVYHCHKSISCISTHLHIYLISLLNPGLAHIFHASFITPKQKFW